MFRFDSAATVHVGRPLAKLIRRGAFRLPILMYHSVTEECSTTNPYFETNVHPQVFREHMRFLHDQGYAAVSVREAARLLSEESGDSKYVAITFDDGFRDFRTHAYPVLSEAGFTATVYLVAGLVDDKPRQFKGRECLRCSEIRELQRQGISFGSHTLTHPQLRDLPLEEAKHEIVHSKTILEDKLGQAIESFSYPYAFPEADAMFSRQLQETLASAGYRDGVTTIIGTANRGSNRLVLPRLPMNRFDDTTLFQAKLEGGYDWLHWLQASSKKLRQAIRS